jgi:hypothetical protein
VSLTASFLGSKIRQKIICEKSKIYKTLEMLEKSKKLKITFKKSA